ncbi:MAG: SUMF1/EgtB/PvdO family nonheme iron enzyme [Candidatus Cloacimonadaceae bacterium]
MKLITYLIIGVLCVCILFSCSEKKTTETNQAAKPTYNLPSGVYTATDTLIISCATPEATINYSIDGSEPTQNSIRYEHPIVINQTTIVQARSYKDDLEPSEVAKVRLIMNVTTIALTDVPAGTFTMGRTKGDGDPDELPTHQVSTGAFKIAPTETIYRDWRCLMGNSAYATNDTVPVFKVSWYDALVYCNLRSLAENLTPCYSIGGKTHPDDWGNIPSYFRSDWDAVICNWNADGYRLPTEAEWEFAARGASDNPDYLFAGSDSLSHVGWYYDNSEGIHCCGCLQTNSLGLKDMSGNVWEWCWDRMDSLYYNVSPNDNPKGPNDGIWRVLRGGGYKSGEKCCRVAERDYSVPYYRHDCVGIRVVRKN